MTTGLANEIREAAEWCDLEFDDEYSGRGMFGATCLSVSGKEFDFAEFWARLPESTREELGEPSRDSMGLGIVYYWRNARTGEPTI